LGKDKKVADNVAFEADLESGIIRRRADGARVMALGSVGWVTLENELASTFVTGGAVILQRMGYSYGKTVAKLAVHNGATSDDVLDVITRHAREAGWGRMSLNSGDMNIGQARLVMRNCYFCLHWKNPQEPVCHMLGGFIAGVADEMLGKVHRVLEQRCVAKGDAICEIAVDRLDS
jgi:predicted hydrocarbon binding protein